MWVGPAEGTWQTASNWSTEEVPTSTDVACIGAGKVSKVTAGSHEVSIVQGEGTLKVRESTLEVLNSEEPSAIGALVVEYNANLTGPATVEAVESFEWAHASTMSGKGSTVLRAGATGAITTGGGWANLEERTLVNEGAFSVNSGILRLKENAVLENTGTLTVNHEAGVFDIFAPSESGALLINKGTLQKTSGSGETHIEVDLENEGEINAETGNFGFTQEGGTGVLADDSILKGSVRLEGPSFTGENFKGKEADLTIREATLAVAKGHAAEIGSMTLDYKANIAGEGALEITGEVLWKSNSSMSGTGKTVVTPAAEVTITTYTAELIERTLVNEGTFTLEGEGTLKEREGAVFENEATFYANSVVSYARFPGVKTGEPSEVAPAFVNDGTIKKTVGTSATRMNVDLENDGAIEIETGELLFEQPETTAVFAAGSQIEGDLRFEEAGIDGEDFTVDSGSLTVRESPVGVEGESTSIENLKVEYGTTWTGGGDFEVTKVFDWHGQSTLGGTGKTTLGPESENILNSGATEVTLDEREIVNKGTFTQMSSSRLKMAGESTFRNKGTYNLNSEPYPTWIRDSIRYDSVPASGRLINEGLFQRTEGKLALQVTPLFENLGVLEPKSSGIEIKNPVGIKADERFGTRCYCGDPVEPATGDLTESQSDFVIGGRGVGLLLTRTYSAQAAASASSAGAFGYGWSGSFSDHLEVEEEGASVTLVSGDGSTVPFMLLGGTTYAAPAWSQDTLSGSSEAGYTLTQPSQTTYAFSGSGRLESLSDRNGNETSLSYDEAGRLEVIEDPAGRRLTLAYDEAGQVKTAEDPMGHVVEYAYEGGELTSVTMPGEEGPRWQFAYDASRRLTTMTDGRGGEVTNEYDGSDRVISQTDPASRTLDFEYDAFHTTITSEATGAVTDIWFTSNNQPYSITRGYGTEDATTETFAYDEAGRLVSQTDGNGHTTTYGYDEAGNRTSAKDALNQEAEWTYNEMHDVISVTTPLGETTTIERDANGNPESVSRPAPGEATQTTTVEYDEYGQLESVTDPLERTVTFGYNGRGDRTSEVDPLGNTWTHGYDDDSRLISTVSPRGNAEGAEAAEYESAIERDPQGRPVEITDPLGNATEYAYDGNGNLRTETDAKSNTTEYTYNAGDELIEEERPNGAILKTGYDGAGRITSQTDANEQTTEYVRDVLGQPVEVIDPLERKTVNEFDAAGNIESATDAAERKTTYVYDAVDQLTDIDFSDEATSDGAFEYDADGNLVAMTDGSGESSFEYDQLGRLTDYENGNGDVVGYGYDLAEGLTSIVYPNGEEVSRAFDGAGRLESVTDWLEGTTSFSYDADSSLTETTFPSATGNVDEYAYDRAGRMSKATLAKGAETLASLSYGRDKLGQVEEEARSGLPGPEELAFGYDENNRLTSAGEEGFEYDAADNLTEGLGSTNTYDAASQLETGTGVSYAFDELGERTKATPEAGPATEYGYDQAGVLTSVERPEEGEVPAISESFAYDGSGLLASRTSGETTRHLTWDVGSDLPLLLSDEENSYVYGPGGLPVEQISMGEEEEPTYLHHDQLGSTRLLTDAEGEASASISYGPYGEVEGSTGAATTTLGFAGQYTDAQTGLQYLRARWYDPATGQFLTRDPIEAITGEPYVYASDNPLNAVDPSGLSVIAVPAGIACAAGPLAALACAGAGATACVLVAGCREAAADAASEIWNGLGNDAPSLSPLERRRLENGECRVDDYGWSYSEGGPIDPPARPYTGADAPDRWANEQGRPRGISRGQVRERLHDAKEGAGLGADDDVVIGRTGDIYDPRTGERIGSLTEPVN